MKVKSSCYNCSFSASDGELCFFNTRTARSVKFSPLMLDAVNTLMLADYVEFDLCNPFHKQLLDYVIFVPDDFDEVRWIELKYNEMIYDTSYLSVTVMPTTKCNFRCVYCYETPEETFMSEDTIFRIKLFFDRKAIYCKQIKISWFGGEPLLYKDTVLEIMRHVDALCRQYGVALVGTMNTNGYLLDVDTFNTLVSLRVRTFEICIDGVESTHNCQRPHSKNNDSYLRIVSNLTNIRDNAKSSAFRIGIRTNVTSQIEPVLDEHLRIVSSAFAKDERFYVSFQGVRDWGGSRIDDSMVLGTNKEKEVHREWYKVALAHGMKSIEMIPIIPFAGYCDAIRTNGYVINYDGTLHKCTIVMYSEEYADVDRIGYIDQYGNPVIDEEKLAQWTIRPTPIRESCKQCSLFPLCIDGSCAFQRIDDINLNAYRQSVEKQLALPIFVLNNSNDAEGLRLLITEYFRE